MIYIANTELNSTQVNKLTEKNLQPLAVFRKYSTLLSTVLHGYRRQ